MSKITLTGNITHEPEIHYTSNGQAVVSFRLAVSNRYQDSSGSWQEREADYYSITAWRKLAENIAACVSKGDRLIVTGKLTTRTFTDDRFVNRETGDAMKRTVTEVQAEDVAVSVRYSSIRVDLAPATTEQEARDQADEQIRAWNAKAHERAVREGKIPA